MVSAREVDFYAAGVGFAGTGGRGVQVLGLCFGEEIVFVGAVGEDEGEDEGGDANGVADVVEGVGIIVFAFGAVGASSLVCSVADRDGCVWA